MSPKELLYIEDALSHEEHMYKACESTASQLQDADLKNFVSQLASKHRQNFTQLYQLLK